MRASFMCCEFSSQCLLKLNSLFADNTASSLKPESSHGLIKSYSLALLSSPSSLKRLLEHPTFEVLAVVTQPDKRRGRGNQTTPSAGKSLALAHITPACSFTACEKKDAETLLQLKQVDQMYLLSLLMGQILSQEILDILAVCMNVHGSICLSIEAQLQTVVCLYRGERPKRELQRVNGRGDGYRAMLVKAYTNSTHKCPRFGF